MHVRAERRLGWITKNGQRYPDGKASDWIEAIRDGLCPFCGSGPFVVVAKHVSMIHDITPAELRDWLGVNQLTAICHPDHSKLMSELARERYRNREAPPASRPRSHRRARGWPSGPILDVPEHGLVKIYARGCRCDQCRAAWADKQAELRASRQARLEQLPAEKHGLLSTYRNWGCRCDGCRAAGKEANRRYEQSARYGR